VLIREPDFFIMAHDHFLFKSLLFFDISSEKESFFPKKTRRKLGEDPKKYKKIGQKLVGFFGSESRMNILECLRLTIIKSK